VEGDGAPTSERAAYAAPNRLDVFVDKSTAASRAASLSRMAFSFRQIQYFVVAAENGALSWAARELSISQSTVAEAIRDVPESTACHRWDCLERGLSSESVACGVEVVLVLLRAKEIADFTDGAPEGVDGLGGSLDERFYHGCHFLSR
jgi:hypothetical protein